MKIINKEELYKLIHKKWLEKYKDKITLEMEEVIEENFSRILKECKNKERIVKNDSQKEQGLPSNVLSKEQIDTLPNRVKENIDNAVIIWSSKKVIQVQDWRKYHLDNKLNDLSWWEWTFFLNSVISTRYTTSWEDSFAHDIRKIHPSPKPPQLMSDIIKFFTKKWDLVFDYFMWVWGSLLWASISWRNAIWIDLENKYIDAYKQASERLWLKEQIAIQGDSVKLLKWKTLDKYFKDRKSKLILIDPPYWNMMARKKTGEAIKQWKSTDATPFTDLEEDLGNMDRWTFRKTFKNLVEDSLKYLDNKWHVVVFLKDIQPQDWNTNLWHADVINDLNSIKWLNYLWTKIRADLWVNLYPYWYPYAFVSNQIHQYIMIFKKD